MKKKKDYGNYRGRYNPTTIEEALNRKYIVKPHINGFGDCSSGIIRFPKCLIGKEVYLKNKAISLTKKEILKMIDVIINSCKENCFCYGLNKSKSNISSQNKCANCHSREQLEELKKQIEGKK